MSDEQKEKDVEDLGLLDVDSDFMLSSGPGLDLGQDPYSDSVLSWFSCVIVKLEPLGFDFEKVLEENIWDLYES